MHGSPDKRRIVPNMTTLEVVGWLHDPLACLTLPWRRVGKTLYVIGTVGSTCRASSICLCRTEHERRSYVTVSGGGFGASDRFPEHHLGAVGDVDGKSSASLGSVHSGYRRQPTRQPGRTRLQWLLRRVCCATGGRKLMQVAGEARSLVFNRVALRFQGAQVTRVSRGSAGEAWLRVVQHDAGCGYLPDNIQRTR